MSRERYEQILRTCGAYRGMDILDVSPGSGDGVQALERNDHRVVRLASYGLGQKQRSTAEMCLRLPDHDDSYDVVTGLEILEQVTSPLQALLEIRRVLRAQGLLFVGGAERVSGTETERPHLRKFCDEEIEGLVTRAGFFAKSWLSDSPPLLSAEPDDTWGDILARASLLAMSDGRAAAEILARVDVASMPHSAQLEMLLLGSEAMLECGEISTALDLATGADRLEPKSARAIMSLGKIAIALGDTETALFAFEQAAHRAPECYSVWLALATTYERAGDLPTAMQGIEEALRIAPADEEVVKAAIRIAGAKGDSDRVRAVLDRVGSWARSDILAACAQPPSGAGPCEQGA